MNKTTLLALMFMLSACDKPIPFESAEVLAENYDRLEELNQLCKKDRDRVGDVQCNEVTKAQRIRFMGKGTSYTPYPVELFGSETDAGFSNKENQN